MSRLIKKGDIVVPGPDIGHWRAGGQGDGSIGIVVYTNFGLDLPFKINWFNGDSNSYAGYNGHTKTRREIADIALPMVPQDFFH